MGQASRTHQDRTVQRRVKPALLGALLVISATTSEAQSAVKQVLLLQSLDRGSLILDQFTGEFRVGLDQRVGQPVNVVQVVVGRTGLVGAAEQAVVDYIRSIYAGRPAPDVVMSVGGPAAAFAHRQRGELFPAKPLLVAAVDQRWLRDKPLGENETAVAVANDFPRLIDDILHVLPETRNVFMVMGGAAIGRFWRGELNEAFSRFGDRVTFEWSDDMSLPDVMRHVAVLPPRSAIVYVTVGTDAQGGTYADEQVLADLHAAANAPMFASQSPIFGHGVVGGSMLLVEDLARRTADVATRLLNGEPAGGIRIPPAVPGKPMFDWRELKRWRIPESRLPAESIVRFRSATLWDEHRATVLTAVGALVLQSFLIALLLYERRARQRAEIESRRNLSLAADANRRETVSTLTNSIAHEISQPLSAITYNAQALQLMLTGSHPAPEESMEILRDINTEAVLAKQILERHRAMLRGHQLQKTSIDLHAVIEETLALLAHDLRSRQIGVVLELSSVPCIIEGDQVFLEQVLVNLVRNAIDALEETPPTQRRLTIRSQLTPTGVEISVSDNGSGLAANIVGDLFTPFVTTKAQGLGIGLTIALRIAEAHGGKITASGNAEGGATFTVALARATTTRSSPTSSAQQSRPEDARSGRQIEAD